MVTLTLTFLVILFALYYAFQGKRVTIQAKDYTLNGRLYGKIGDHKHGSAKLDMNVSDLSDGIYIVKASKMSSGETSTGRFIKK